MSEKIEKQCSSGGPFRSIPDRIEMLDEKGLPWETLVSLGVKMAECCNACRGNGSLCLARKLDIKSLLLVLAVYVLNPVLLQL